MAWKIKKNQTGYPIEFLVDEETILLDRVDMDSSLPLGGDKVGNIVYNAEMSIIKQRDFDGSWKEIQIGSDVSGGGILVGLVDQTMNMPTQRDDGSPLQNEDYVKPKANATFPFTIDGITFENRFSKAIYFNGEWILDTGLIQDTSETPLASPTTEIWEEERRNQYQLNLDIVNQLRNSIIEYADLNTVPSDRLYRRIYRQTADTADRVTGLYWYNFNLNQWEKFGSGDIEAGIALPSGKYEGQLFILLQKSVYGGEYVNKGLYRYDGTQWVKVETVSTKEAILYDPTEEKFEEERENQYELNKDIMYQLKNAIIEYADLDTVPADKLYKRIYRQTEDTDARISGLYWYNFDTSTWENLGSSTIDAGNLLPSGRYDGELFILLEDVAGNPKTKKGLYRFNGNLWVHIAHTEPWTSEIEVEDAETESISKSATTQKEINDENALIIGQEKEIEVDEEVDLIGAVNWLNKNKLGQKKLTVADNHDILDEDGNVVTIDEIKEFFNSKDYWLFLEYRDTIFLPTMADNENEFKFLGDFSIPQDVTSDTQARIEAFAEIVVKEDNKAYFVESANETSAFKVSDIDAWLEEYDRFVDKDIFYPNVEAVLKYFKRIKEAKFEVEPEEYEEGSDVRVDKVTLTLTDDKDEEIAVADTLIDIKKITVWHYDVDIDRDTVTDYEFHAKELEKVMNGVVMSSVSPFSVKASKAGYLEASNDGENFTDAADGVEAVLKDGKYMLCVHGDKNLGNLNETTLQITGSDVTVSGDLRELLDYNNPETATIGEYTFSRLFSGQSAIVDASELVMLNTVATNSYIWMFNDCTNLVKAPKVIPNASANGTCYYMFDGCTSLTQPPELPEVTLGKNAYSFMFDGCTSLVEAPYLPATSVLDSSYSGMFRNCTSLTKIQDNFSIVNWVYSAAQVMFSGCSSLTHASTFNEMQSVGDMGLRGFFNNTGIRLYTSPRAGYTRPWSLPSGVVTTGSDWNQIMFPSADGGVVTPEVGVTYYTNDL